MIREPTARGPIGTGIIFGLEFIMYLNLQKININKSGFGRAILRQIPGARILNHSLIRDLFNQIGCVFSNTFSNIGDI